MADNLFSKRRLGDTIEYNRHSLSHEIESMDRDYILNVSTTDLVDHLFEKYSIKVPILHEDQKYIAHEGEVMAEVLDNIRLTRVKMMSVTIAIPFSGSREMLHLSASSQCPGGGPFADTSENEIRLTFVVQNNNPEVITHHLERSLKEIRANLAWQEQDLKPYNSGLRNTIKESIRRRRETHLANMEMLKALNIPIRSREGQPATYKIPDIQRRIEIPKPQVNTLTYKPEPEISMHDYEYILQALEQMVIAMERSPETYQSMGEEDLRNLLLMQLNVAYQGRATGETFNRSGKTDILVREEGKNVFVAECKIWHGTGQYNAAIDQLLGYTCWRDTKTALLVFNRNKDHTAVMGQIKETTMGHACCKKLLHENGTGHFRFLFHQPDDKNREMYVSAMAFHVPK